MIKLVKSHSLPKISGGSKAPTIQRVLERTLLWFSSRDDAGYSYPQCLDPTTITFFDIPMHLPKRTGTAYDSGIMPSQVIDDTLLFTGWNRGNDLCKYRNSMLKYSFVTDKVSFISDRSDEEPIGTSMPFLWWDTLFYMSFRAWSGGESIYDIKSVKVDKNLKFLETPKVILRGQYAYARPWLSSFNGITYLWYCYRHFLDFRTNPEKSYKIGVLRLEAGEWVPEELDTSGLGDELMQAYPCVMDDTLYYNNDFDSPIQVAKIHYGH